MVQLFNTVFGMRVVYERNAHGLNLPQQTLQVVMNPSKMVAMDLPKNPRVIGRKALDVCEIDNGLYAWFEQRPHTSQPFYCLFLLATGQQASEAFDRIHGSCGCGLRRVIEKCRTLQASADPASDQHGLSGAADCDLTTIYDNVKAAHTLRLAAGQGLLESLDVQRTVFSKEYAVR